MPNHPENSAPGEPTSDTPKAPERTAAERRRDVLTLDLPLIFGLTLCTVLTIVEATRAVGGNARSWAYTFEWPLIGAFICWIWYRYRVSVRRSSATTDDQTSSPTLRDPRTELPPAVRPSNAVSAGREDQADYGFAALGRSLTSRWRAQVAEAEAAYDREHDEALRAWEAYARDVREREGKDT